MVQDACPVRFATRPDLRGALISHLHCRAAVRAVDAARHFRIPLDTARAELDALVYAGLVEVLRPVSADRHADGHPLIDFDLEYYRWIRASDNDYEWQAALVRPGRVQARERQVSFTHF